MSTGKAKHDILTLAWIPNMLSFFNLLTGFLAILKISEGKYEQAVWLMTLSLVWDSLDGNIARIFKNPTQFGRELDSLADTVSFVTAPAYLTAIFLLNNFNSLILILPFLYLVAGAYRLARFNMMPPVKNYFEGLPTPAAAITLSMTILACMKDQWMDAKISMFVVAILSLVISFLMVSRICYPKLSAIRFSKWQSLFYAGAVLFLVVFLKFNSETAIASVFLLFLFLAPLYCLSSHGVHYQAEEGKSDSISG